MSRDDAWALLRSQGYRCAVTGKIFAPGDEVHLDHCHATNRARGFVLAKANRILGAVGDSVDELRAYVEYLERHQAPMIKLAADVPDAALTGPHDSSTVKLGCDESVA